MGNVGWDHGAEKHSIAKSNTEVSKPTGMNTKALADLALQQFQYA